MDYTSFISLLEIIMGNNFPIKVKHYPEDGWILFPCPFHNDKNPSFRINYNSGFWQCLSGCGKGFFHSFLMKYKQISYKEADLFLLRRNINFKVKDIKEEKEISGITFESILYRELNKIYKYDFSIFTREYSDFGAYWEKRGFTKKEFEENKNHIYYDKWDNRLLFDCKYAVLSKYIDNNYWSFAKDSNKSLAFYKINRNSETVFLCEGIFDAIALSILFRKYDIIAILGNSISKEKFNYIMRFYTNVVLSFDNDDGGRQATKSSLEYFNDKNKEVSMLLYEGKDPNMFLLSGIIDYKIKNLKKIKKMKLNS